MSTILYLDTVEWKKQKQRNNIIFLNIFYTKRNDKQLIVCETFLSATLIVYSETTYTKWTMKLQTFL